MEMDDLTLLFELDESFRMGHLNTRASVSDPDHCRSPFSLFQPRSSFCPLSRLFQPQRSTPFSSERLMQRQV